MIFAFKDRGTEEIFDGEDSKDALRVCPINLWSVARRKLDQLNAAISLNDLRVPPGNRLEALQGEREGQHSIRINDRYRIYFVWLEQEASAVEIVDRH
ncbi:type II toxin-antitoxin system RelE/ParE family toxin [Chroococcidiopsis sp. FACHB-1243]|uniref:type II toxin-antitoxin system RelE/ParE family toxin n=1 Tax=Chroococcidiopsis sp. [FACHB-1243] TaxID=2692781 RepID=UPI00177E6C0A|nr:type II toxin-antitoxin system RelE/ParE family toxin [Chroococcidiopsis sp. [FACHB-1243]]MBD2309399.1 type II toxin-antitoxin system RelE/ParE family toxin [Chroococcidiopsis sp. [FACHB-1243]]